LGVKVSENDCIKITINNWGKYNKGSWKPKSPWWFPVFNGIHFDRDFIEFDFEERWVWICILAEASRNRKNTLELHLALDGKNWGLNPLKIASCVAKLKEKHIVRCVSGMAQAVHNTIQDNTRHKKGKSKKTENEQKEQPQPANAVADDFVFLWNQKRGPLAEVKKITTQRERKIKQALAEIPDFNDWDKIFTTAAASPFHCGENNRGWRADFDFCIRPDKAIMFLEMHSSPAKSKFVEVAQP